MLMALSSMFLELKSPAMKANLHLKAVTTAKKPLPKLLHLLHHLNYLKIKPASRLDNLKLLV
jgi:hypothetical protein